MPSLFYRSSQGNSTLKGKNLLLWDDLNILVSSRAAATPFLFYRSSQGNSTLKEKNLLEQILSFNSLTPF